MKFRLPPWNLPNPTDSYRFIFSHTLHIRHSHSLLISHPHLPRRQLRLDYPIYTCQRGFHILHLPVPARRTGSILWILYIPRDMEHWHHPIIRSYSNSIHRLRSAMRANILLRCNRNYQLAVSHPLHRNQSCRVNLRRVLGRQSHPNAILRLPLYPAIYCLSISSSTPSIPPRNRI